MTWPKGLGLVVSGACDQEYVNRHKLQWHAIGVDNDSDKDQVLGRDGMVGTGRVELRLCHVSLTHQ